MIVWGGTGDDEVQQPTPRGPMFTQDRNDGGRYDPVADTWAPLSLLDAPGRRHEQTAVWTGSEMIVWGGDGNDGRYPLFGDGARYDPVTGKWARVSPEGGLSPRTSHTAVWTGAQMITWGGGSGVITSEAPPLGDGAAYDPATDTWTLLPAEGAPAARQRHVAAWTGTEMLVWGGVRAKPYGRSIPDPQADGGRYQPAAE